MTANKNFHSNRKKKQGHVSTILEFHWLKLKTTTFSGDFKILFHELSATTVAFTMRWVYFCFYLLSHVIWTTHFEINVCQVNWGRSSNTNWKTPKTNMRWIVRIYLLMQNRKETNICLSKFTYRTIQNSIQTDLHHINNWNVFWGILFVYSLRICFVWLHRVH